MRERIQKVLTTAGVLSRRKTEEYIKQGKITVNGRPAEIGQAVDLARDVVVVDGQRVYAQKRKEKIYIMMNKPRGYVTTTSDELGRRSVMDLLQDIDERVYPIGRLDKNSEGLLLFTNDGDFANRLMHPKSLVAKTYRVTVRPKMTEDQAIQLSVGVDIGEGEITQPANVVILESSADKSSVQITITEGKNRQIRRMCEAVGLEVARLRRISEGPLKLGMLQPGQWRELKKSEVIALKNASRAKDAPLEGLNGPDTPTKAMGSFGKEKTKKKKTYTKNYDRQDNNHNKKTYAKSFDRFDRMDNDNNYNKKSFKNKYIKNKN